MQNHQTFFWCCFMEREWTPHCFYAQRSKAKGKVTIELQFAREWPTCGQEYIQILQFYISVSDWQLFCLFRVLTIIVSYFQRNHEFLFFRIQEAKKMVDKIKEEKRASVPTTPTIAKGKKGGLVSRQFACVLFCLCLFIVLKLQMTRRSQHARG